MRHVVLCVVAGCALGVTLTGVLGKADTAAGATTPHRVAAPVGGQALRHLPAAFVPNVGQWEHPAQYVARFGPMTMFLQEDGWWLQLAAPGSSQKDRRDVGAGTEQPQRDGQHGVALRMTFVDADAPRLVEGGGSLPGVHNYFLGNDPARWRTAVPRFDSVTYRGLYPGVDVRAYEKDGHFEYDLALIAGADISRVEMRVEGADRLHIDSEGALVISTSAGAVRQPPPLAFTIDAAGSRQRIACEVELRGADSFGFVAPAWDGVAELLVDPGLIYSTFLGGSSTDGASALSVDAAGVVTMAGNTSSVDFPTTPGAWDAAFNGGADAFVARLDPRQTTAQQLVYATFLGGWASDYAVALSVDATGVVTVVGKTVSADFPTTQGAWDRTFSVSAGGGDAFVARLDPRLASAQQLVYSTFLGGAGVSGRGELGWDEATDLSVDDAGVVTVTGLTMSGDFPTTASAWDRTYNGGPFGDAFVARLDPRLSSAQQLLYSTFLGGTGSESASALSVDAAGVATPSGDTTSVDFPTTPAAWDDTHNGDWDVFVATLDPRLASTQQLTFSTFLGGSTYESVSSLAVAADGVVTLAGATSSGDFPATSGAWDTSYNGPPSTLDAFVAQIDPRLPSTRQLVYSTFLGGASYDSVGALSVGVDGIVTVAGSTFSTDFPTTPGCWDTTHNGGPQDAFVARLDLRLPAPQQLVYSTFLGGSLSEGVSSLLIDASGVVTVAGSTQSADFPITSGAWDATFNGAGDAFLARLDVRPTGTRRFGTSSPGCSGHLAISVESVPRVGNSTFQLSCTNAPPMTTGALLLAGRGLTSPLRLLGVDVWLDPTSAWFLAPLALSNAVGEAHFPLPIPGDSWLAGLQLNAQFVWAGPTAPPPCPPLGFSASNALAFTIQP